MGFSFRQGSLDVEFFLQTSSEDSDSRKKLVNKQIILLIPIIQYMLKRRTSTIKLPKDEEGKSFRSKHKRSLLACRIFRVFYLQRKRRPPYEFRRNRKTAREGKKEIERVSDEPAFCARKR